jgi:hypothetical protein
MKQLFKTVGRKQTDLLDVLMRPPSSSLLI